MRNFTPTQRIPRISPSRTMQYLLYVGPTTIGTQYSTRALLPFKANMTCSTATTPTTTSTQASPKNYIEKCDLVWGADGEPLYLNSNFEQRVEREAGVRDCAIPTIVGLRTNRRCSSSARVSSCSSARKSIDEEDEDVVNSRRRSSSSFMDRVRRFSLSKSPVANNSRSVHINSR